MRVIDLMSGVGWYADVLARAVGPEGRVIAQNNSISNDRYGGALAEHMTESGLANVDLLVADLDALSIEDVGGGNLDAAFMVQFYHDTVWMGVDRSEMLRRILAALRPGGRFIVIDHHAKKGAGLEAVETLHRIEEGNVIAEIEAAGFHLVHRSSMLSNRLDDREKIVLDPRVRGGTDRFLLRFEKPLSQKIEMAKSLAESIEP